jgi:hypothetical protein
MNIGSSGDPHTPPGLGSLEELITMVNPERVHWVVVLSLPDQNTLVDCLARN